MRGLVAALAWGSLAALGCKSESGALPAPTVCNGHRELCDRRYDQVAFPGTHDAYSNITEGFGIPDQTYPISRQLQDGVRVLHLEIVLYVGDLYVCHALCAAGKTLLVDTLGEVSTFVGAHPDEAVTLLMESSGVKRDDVATALQKSGLVPSLHVQPAGSAWPTLGAMIQHGDRVVAFLADLTHTGGTGTYPWLLDRFGSTWETPWDNEQPSDFGRCGLDRGTPGAPIYVVDTYLEDQTIPTPDHAALVNTNPFLIDRLLYCKQMTGALPNFAMVNYYEVGDLFPDVDVLNGFAPPPNDDLTKFPPAAWPDAGAAEGGSPEGGDQ